MARIDKIAAKWHVDRYEDGAPPSDAMHDAADDIQALLAEITRLTDVVRSQSRKGTRDV